MSDSFQNEIPTSRVNIKLDLHTGGAQKQVELPLKLICMGDYSNGKETRTISERKKININKNNFNQVLAEFNPALQIIVEDTLSNEKLSNENVERAINLDFTNIKDFEPESIARQIPELRAILSMRNLLRDLRSNILDNMAFRKEFEKILKDQSLSDKLRSELALLEEKIII